MAQTLGSYDCAHRMLIDLMVEALTVDGLSNGSRFPPKIRTELCRSLRSLQSKYEAVTEHMENRVAAVLMGLAGKFLETPIKYAMLEQRRLLEDSLKFCKRAI